jgi:hypothetical protein
MTMSDVMEIIESDYMIIEVRRPTNSPQGIFRMLSILSMKASEKLIKLGYTKIVEFGGILYLQDETEK